MLVRIEESRGKQEKGKHKVAEAQGGRRSRLSIAIGGKVRGVGGTG